MKPALLLMHPCLFAPLLLATTLAVAPGVAQFSRHGSLFSAIVCADTSFGTEWARLRPLAQARFPGLKLTRLEDLHVTVVYIGPGWKNSELELISPLARTGPETPTSFDPEVVSFGVNHEVAVVELHNTSIAWGEAVTAAKTELNRLGLKQPDRYDANFRPHLTLAQVINRPPNPTDTAELAAFLDWMKDEIARDPEKFTLTLGPATPVRLLLAGTPRPAGAPDYVTVEEFYGRPPAN